MVHYRIVIACCVLLSQLHTIKFTYPTHVQEFLHDLILGLTYFVKFPHPVNLHELFCDLILGLTYPVKLPYPIKSSLCKSTHFSKAIIISSINHSFLA